VVDTRLNSIFIFACIRAKIAEFIRENTVKNETIKIETRASEELYPGRKNAAEHASIIIAIQRTRRRDIIFQTILF
jgi:hypothetical protein